MTDSVSSSKCPEDTLEDGAWKDSFDKLLEPRPVLRELNVLKQVVHASFNRDSSVENSVRSDANGSPLLAPPMPTITVDNLKGEMQKRNHSVSTPVTNRLVANPFKCSLSPIGAWCLRYFDRDTNAIASKEAAVCGPQHATPINPEIIVADYDETTEDDISFLPAEYLPRIRSKRCSIVKQDKLIQNQRRVCFRSVVNESKTSIRSSMLTVADATENNYVERNSQILPNLTLQPGKWKKSLNILRRTQLASYRNSNAHRQSGKVEHSVEFIGIVSVAVGERKSIFLKPERQSESFQHNSCISDSDNIWEYRVLERCKQKEPMSFEEVYSPSALKYCQKIGEGAYGEVFLSTPNKRRNPGTESTVMKVIPIEGGIEVNGEVQKTYKQILSEVVISEELSKLRHTTNAANVTPCFVGVKKIVCVKGKYPNHLIKYWEDYEKKNGSDNDHPEIFDDTQIFLVLEIEFGGKDMESFEFLNGEQSYYALYQIVLTLAVAEEAMQFEHRDLHWGNVLLVNTNMKTLQFKLNNQTLTVPTKGIKVTIIDYTLSRMTFDDCCHYNDLSSDEELFSATGDYQYDIYRMMRETLKNNWESFNPRTNIFWISYILDKLCKGVTYRNKRTKTHSAFMDKLHALMNNVLDFNSAKACAEHLMTIG